MGNNYLIHLNHLIERYPALAVCQEDIKKAYHILELAYTSGNKLLVCGNGGSASDSEHIVGTLMKGFVLKRKLNPNKVNALKSVDPELGQVLADNLQEALPAISLIGHPALQTAYINDAIPDLVFAQQVNGFGKPGDVLFGISTSGNSKNVLYSAVTAKANGLKVIGLTGAKENKLMKYSDVCIRVPETVTFKIQELHISVYHCLVMMLEEKFFGE